MAAHRKKPKLLINPTDFVESATRFHTFIQQQKLRVRLGTPHWRALEQLGDEVRVAIREITGEEVPWERSGPSAHTAYAGADLARQGDGQ